MTVNYMFGILTPRSAQVESYEGYRFSNAAANTTQRRLLGKVLTFSTDPKQSLLLTDFILKLLSCSPYWPQLIRDLDLYNTYDVSVVSDPGAMLKSDPMQLLLDWENSWSGAPDMKFTCSPQDPAIDRICAKLASVLYLKGD